MTLRSCAASPSQQSEMIETLEINLELGTWNLEQEYTRVLLIEALCVIANRTRYYSLVSVSSLCTRPITRPSLSPSHLQPHPRMHGAPSTSKPHWPDCPWDGSKLTRVLRMQPCHETRALFEPCLCHSAGAVPARRSLVSALLPRCLADASAATCTESRQRLASPAISHRR